LRWFYGGGAGQFWPDVWQRFLDPIPEDERDDLIRAYHRRLFSGDLMIETRHARAWASWENTLASIENDGPGGDSPAEYARAFARLENHYFMNGGFLEEDGQILRNMDCYRRGSGDHRAGALRHDLSAGVGAAAARGLAAVAAGDRAAGGPCAVRAGDQRRARADDGSAPAVCRD
jgi:proline iminopeptidase